MKNKDMKNQNKIIKRAKLTGKTLLVTGIAYMALSGAFVAHNAQSILLDFKTASAASGDSTEAVTKVLDNFTEDQILYYLAANARGTETYEISMEQAEEMIVTGIVENKLDVFKLKVQSGYLFKGKDLAKDGEDRARQLRQQIESEKVEYELTGKVER